MDRRAFLATTAASLVGTWSTVAAPGRTLVSSDVDPLRRVLMHPPCSAAWWPIPDEDDSARVIDTDDPLWTEEVAHEMWTKGVAQHLRLHEHLVAQNVEIVPLEHVLDEAIVRCRQAGQLGEWVLSTVPALEGREAEINATLLLEAAPYPIGVDHDAEEPPDPMPLRWVFYTRDIGTMTPKGLLVSNFINRDRMPEAALFRFALQWSPSLRAYPIAFDATRAKMRLQGGDVLVADDKTLFLGVGNLTERAVAPKLARALRMDVVTVQLPGDLTATPWYGLRKLFLHLDTILGLLAPRTVVTLPYVFESKYTERDALPRLAGPFRKLPGGDAIDFRKTMRVLKDVGRVQRFLAGSGSPDTRVDGMKLVDYLRSIEYEMIFVGGDPPKTVDAGYVKEHVIREMRRQAANVVAVAPRKVIAYEENPHTLRALRKADIDVTTFPGSELARWHGGPHCLTFPLERG